MSTEELLANVLGLVQKTKNLQAERDALAAAFQSLTETNGKLTKEREELLNQVTDLTTKSTVGQNKTSNHLQIAMRLRKMGLRYRNIKGIFKIGTTVLAGGFVLQTILGEHWQTDLDIFTTHAQQVIDELSKFGWVVAPKVVETRTPNISGPYADYYKLRGIEKVYRGEFVNGTFIEIIETRDPIQNIREFDFDFCKCYYNGSNFYAMNCQAIVTKTCWVAKDSVKQNRIDKYKLRGFTINIGQIKPKFRSDNESENEEEPIPESVAEDDAYCDVDCDCEGC